MSDHTQPLYWQTRKQVKIGAEALAEMLRHRQSADDDLEAGGILLGHVIEDSGALIIDQVTTPGPADVRGRHFFNRDHAYHQAAIEAAWIASDSTCQYLGEWHTHPERHPTPSEIDLADWRRRLTSDHFETQHLAFVVVGTEGVAGFIGDKGTATITALTDSPDVELAARYSEEVARLRDEIYRVTDAMTREKSRHLAEIAAMRADMQTWKRDHEALEYLRGDEPVISGVTAQEPGVWFATDWDGDQVTLTPFSDPASAILAARDAASKDKGGSDE